MNFDGCDFDELQRREQHGPTLPGKYQWRRCAIELRQALDESVRLQAHYAALLNLHDGGQRRIFENSAAWLARLRETRRSDAQRGATSGVESVQPAPARGRQEDR